MTPATNHTFNRLFTFALLVILVIIGLLVFRDLHVKNTTGTLTITAFASDATISITQNNRTAEVVGVGVVGLRLTPGAYQIAVSSNGTSSFTQTMVHRQAHSTIYVGKQRPAIASPDTINFTGIGALNERGITTDQITNLKKLFFKYKPKATTISIDSKNITNGQHNPDSDDPFTLNFTGTIDEQKYRATITYTDLENLELALHDPQTNAQLFDASSAIPATKQN
jgi:hypothetical protein